MKLSRENKLAFKITILIAFALLISFFFISKASYTFILRSEKDRFLKDIRKVPLTTLVDIILDRKLINKRLPIEITRNVSKMIMFETIKDSLVLKNNFILEKKGLFNYIDFDINILNKFEDGEIKDIIINDNYYLIHKFKFKGLNIFLLKNISGLAKFYKFLIITLFISSIFLLFVIYIISLKLSNLAINPIKEANIKLKEYNHNIAHELKTPFSIIKSNLELLEIKKDDNLLKSSKEEIDYIAKIIDSLLFLSNNKKIDKKDKIILERAILEVIKSNNFPKNRIKIFKQDNNVSLFCDKILLNRLLKNLIENAIKYSTVKSNIDIKITKNTLIISNKFKGEINKNNLGRLFETFYQLDNSRNTLGYGLGLSIVQSIVSKLNWNIKLETEKNEFIIIIEF